MGNIDRHIAILAGWIAGPAFGLAMMAVPGYSHLGPIASGLLFWGGIAVFLATIVVVVTVSAHQKNRRKAVLGPIILMAIGAIIFCGGTAWYFWPNSNGGFNISLESVNIIPIAGNNRVDVIAFARVENSLSENASPSDWRLRITTKSGKSAVANAVPVIEARSYSFTNGQPPVSLIPEASLVGRSQLRYPLGESFGRILFQTNKIPGEEIEQLETKMDLETVLEGKTIKSPVISLSDLSPTR